MIKNLIKPVVIINFVLVLSSAAYPLDINAGLSLWYAKWSPHWENEFRDVFADESSEKSHFNMENTYLYGPVVSIGLTDRLSLAANFLYGKYEASCIKMWYEGAPRVIQAKMEIDKYDSDILFSYSLFRNIQLFFGGKYQRYNLHEKDQGLYQIASDPFYRDLISNSYGPGLGLGISLPAGENFAILMNLSGLYLFTTIEDKWSEESGSNPPSYTYKLHAYGVNSSISLAYFISDANITIVTGFRYQYLTYKQKSVSKKNYDSGDEFRFPRDYDSEKDKFFGISIAAVYKFSI